MIDSGTTGRVIEINWRTTRLLARDQIHLLLPNARLAQQRLTNYSAPRQGSELRLISDNTTFMFGVFPALMFMRKPSVRALMFTMAQLRNIMSTILNLNTVQ